MIFPKGVQVRRRTKYLVYTISLFVLSFTLTPLFVSTAVSNGQVAQLTVGPLYPIYIIYFVGALMLTVYNYLRQYRRGTGSEKAQIKLFVTGVVIYSVFAIVSNAILPVVVQNWSSSRFGPIFTVPFIAITAYAMVRHGLFDIRLVVARSIAYALTLSTLAFLFVVVSFGIFSRFLGTGQLSFGQEAFYIGVAIVIALTFQNIKKFFDKISNRLFYRDAYDPQQLLDQLNKILVSTIDLDKLTSSVSKELAETLKADYCSMIIRPADSDGQERVVGAVSMVGRINPALGKKLDHYVSLTGDSVILVDDIIDRHGTFKDELMQDSIALIIHLNQNIGRHLKGMGYLVLGNKKSGNPYSAQDVRILEIIADELVIAIQNALRFEEIQNFAATLQQKVDEATHKLRRTNEKLRQLDETKDDFISMASHQLRTPLTSVKGYISMVLDGDVGKISAAQRKLLDQAFISSQRMVFLIADLLNVSRLKTGKFVIEPKPTNLAEVVESELRQLQETAKGRDLKLLFQQPKSFPSLNLDETKIRQVIMNFCDNAIYYTPAGGTITVGLTDKPDSVEFTVVDNGIGVPKAEQHHLFSKFYRAGNAKKARPDGTGLGLFMAQKVIVAQGGAIIFTSEENKGSTFGFSFPKAKLLVKG